MIEHVPQQVTNALLYFHSAGTSSTGFQPFLAHMIEQLPNTYIWAGDGVISGSPLMRQGLHYGDDPKRYWFTFPMQDASSQESFASHVEAMGATLACAGAYVNRLADQIMARFEIRAQRVVLCGFQHGSSVALAAAMLRRQDPYAMTILFEPYILESYYLEQEALLPDTTVVCIDNQHIRQRTLKWINVETDREFRGYGIDTEQVTLPDGGDHLDRAMLDAAITVMQRLETY